MNDFVKDLIQHVYCRLAPSPIHGIGVFAVRAVPAGINPMHETRPFEFQQVPVKDVLDCPDLPGSVKKLVLDMCPENDGFYDCPPFSLNEISISWYLNHSNTPNMEERDGDFYTTRAIAEGEELTVDYGSYGELNL